MENRERIRGPDEILHLPETLIQHIQSFLSGKEAVSTTVLFKSWYNSWLTRPDLDFDERDFPNSKEFVNFVVRSMRRYHRLKLKIENLKLSLNDLIHDSSSSFANWLIAEALKMGVKHLTIDIPPRDSMLPLAKELFEASSLIRLSVSGCVIHVVSGEKFMCSRLERLSLTNAWLGDYEIRNSGDYVIRDILASCPLIEHVFLFNCAGFRKLNINKHLNLKEVYILMGREPGVRRSFIEFNGRTPDSLINGHLDVPIFKKLSKLHLERVEIGRAFFCDFSIMFPCLESLTITCCHGCQTFDLSGHSLKFINFQFEKSFKAGKFDVPNIRKFKCCGGTIPSLSFTQSSKEWESDIWLTCWRRFLVSWFVELKIFLEKLSPSKISLAISFMGKNVVLSGDCQSQDSPKPVVENFKLMAMMKHSSATTCSGLWYCLLWSFRPNYVTDICFPKSRYMCAKENHQEFWEALVQRMVRYGTKTTEAIFCIEGLEGLNVEFFEEACLEWKHKLWKTFLDASKISLAGPKIRFALKWKWLKNGGSCSVSFAVFEKVGMRVVNLQNGRA